MSEPLFEIAPDNWISVLQTWRVQLNGTSVDYYYSSTGKETINYGSAQAAEDALAAYVLNANGPPPPIVAGDVVRLRGQGIKNIAENISYTVENVPDLNFPWWALRGSETATLILLAIGDGRSLEKL